MNAPSVIPTEHLQLEAKLRRHIQGDVLFDDFSRGRYSTDASIYQMTPIGVVVPQSDEDVRTVLDLAKEASVPLLPRGGGTSQCGQTVNEALVIDTSRYLNNIVNLGVEEKRVTVQPGIVLDQLNAHLSQHGLFFPVDVSTSSRATIGGMTGNNSCGARSIRYGNTVHNVRAIDAIMANGNEWRFESTSGDLSELTDNPGLLDLAHRLRDIERRERDEIERRWPKVFRNVGGYNLNTINPEGHNLASILVGSEGTLAWFRQIELALSPLPKHKVLGVCRFPKFHDAMANTRHIVTLDPAAVELVDRNMIDLGASIDEFSGVLGRIAEADTDAILLVEFAGEDLTEQLKHLNDLDTLLGDLGFPDILLKVEDPGFQKEIWEVRKAGLNIMMSMKGDAKPVSFVEDCAVPLEHLADYTKRLTEVFEQHGTRGTWYAHASVGCLHVRPVIDMKSQDGGRTMRSIAEQALSLVREYQGAHSGEHGDGIVRSEWLEPMLGARITRAFEEIKDCFDPEQRFNPGKIVHPPAMDDRRLFRFKPGYETLELETGLDWSAWGGFPSAVEMCNNNGACRKSSGNVMCPSFRVTREETHLTRGRANTLRLALSGQLGPDALLSPAMAETMSLCVSCKGCRRECPTGVDMARMKIETLYQRRRQGEALSLRDRLISDLPAYAPKAKLFAGLLNLRDRIPGLARISESLTGFDRRRSLPIWHRNTWLDTELSNASDLPNPETADAVFLVDTFTNSFEPDNARAAMRVLRATGLKIAIAGDRSARPLCCGRTYLAAGRIDKARQEATRLLDALAPYLERGLPVIGLEPSCTLGARDELTALFKDDRVDVLSRSSRLFEEFLVEQHNAGRISLSLSALPERRALLHGHCHQKAFDVLSDVETVLGWIPDLDVALIESSCCGMAGAFGFESEHYDISMKMAEATLLPAVRAAKDDTLIVADGTSCRHQIADGTATSANHVARLLERALTPDNGENT